MTKLEELKAAYEAATPGEWDYVVSESAETPSSFVVDEDGEHILRHRYGVTRKAQRDVEFIALAHNLMPTLLEAVEKLQDMTQLAFDATQYDENDECKAQDMARIQAAMGLISIGRLPDTRSTK